MHRSVDVALLSVLISGTDGLFNYPHQTNALTRIDAGTSRDAYRPRPVNNYNLTGDSHLLPPFNSVGAEDGSNAGTLTEPRRRGKRRTFGHRKRMQLALLPIMYKMGVMTTLLVALTVLALKSLTVGVILLIFAFGNIFSKLHKFHQPQQPIHVHVHSGDVHGKSPAFTSYSSAVDSGGWDRAVDEFGSTGSAGPYQDYGSSRIVSRKDPYLSRPYSRYKSRGYQIT